MVLDGRVKYHLVLALIAAGILAGGLALKPTRQTVRPVDQTERVRLQEISQNRALSDMAERFAKAQQRVSRHVVRILPGGPGGVLLGSVGQVVAAGFDAGDRPVRVQGEGFQGDAVVSRIPANGMALGMQLQGMPQAFPAGLAMGEPPTGAWVILVGRNADGRSYMLPGLFGGTATVECSPGNAVRVLQTGLPIDEEKAGVGMFDLDGALQGMVLRCGSRYQVVAAPELTRLLNQPEPPAQGVFRKSGVLVEPLEAGLRAFLRAPQGLFVKAVRNGSTLSAGDVIVACDGKPAESPDCLATAAEVEVFSRGRRTKVKLGAPVPPTATAGVEPGDVPVAVDGRAVADEAAAARVLTTRGPHLMIVRRGAADYALFVPGETR